MSKTTWKHALLPLQTMFEEAARQYPSLRLLVYDGTVDHWTAQTALNLAEADLLKSYLANPDEEPSRYLLAGFAPRAGQFAYGHLICRKEDECGSAEFHQLAEAAGACLQGWIGNVAGVSIEWHNDEHAVVGWIRTLMCLGNIEESHAFLKWRHDTRELPEGSVIQLLLQNPLLASWAAVRELQKVRLRRLPRENSQHALTLRYRSMILQRMFDEDEVRRNPALPEPKSPLPPDFSRQDLALLRTEWLEWYKVNTNVMSMRSEQDAALGHLNVDAAEDLASTYRGLQMESAAARTKVMGTISELGKKYATISAAVVGEDQLADRPQNSDPVSREYLEALNKIPQEWQSRPMSFADAARFLGLNVPSNKAAQRVRARLIRPIAQKSRQLIVFDLRDFPTEQRDKMR